MEMKELIELCEKLGISNRCEEGLKAVISDSVGRKIRFHFVGENDSYKCNIQTPHAPHVLKTYQCSTRTCVEFCKGRNGKINENMEIVIFGNYTKGNVENPDIFSGYYIILKT